ncbi:MAG: hypothetical protein V4592_08135 [Bacteroidota bacterium]
METLITYDVSRRQPDVKKALKALSYLDYWTADQKTYYLPNTTLWKQNITQAEALKEMQAVITRLNQGQPLNNQIELERCVCVPVMPWAGITGKEHKE